MLVNPFDDGVGRTKARLIAIYSLLLVANVAAWAAAWLLFSGHPVLLGTALLAYVFGLRHAFDADHIAAIDNVVRKLVQDGKRPISAGFFFSLGHSTIVVIASAIIAATAAAMQGRLAAFHEIGGTIGTLVSAFFLLLIGIANLFIFKSIWTAFQQARRDGRIVEEDIDALLANRGLLNRLFQRTFRMVSCSWLMYPVGFLFGLGFDTATEIGLLGISATQAAQGMSFWTIMIFPALFTAGMTLMDTTDSVVMTGAYRWAFVDPIRKLWYNLTITGASVAVAVFIGGIEALGLLSDKFGLAGSFWDAVGKINGDMTKFGYAVVGIFVASWVLSTVIYRLKRYDRAAA